MIFLRLIFIVFFCFSANSLSAGWHDRKAEGWAWYEGRKHKEVRNVEKKETNENSPMQQLEQEKQNLEEKRAIAYLNPTDENILNYMREHYKWLNQSQKFAQIWMINTLKYPELDSTLQGVPLSQYGQKFYRQNKKEERNALIKKLSTQFKLLFLYKGSNPACKEVGKAVSLFSKRHEWDVSAISLDGVIFDELPDGIKHANLTNLDKHLDFPVDSIIALINPNTFELIPIAYGFVSVDNIEGNIELLFAEKNTIKK